MSISFDIGNVYFDIFQLTASGIASLIGCVIGSTLYFGRRRCRNKPINALVGVVHVERKWYGSTGAA